MTDISITLVKSFFDDAVTYLQEERGYDTVWHPKINIDLENDETPYNISIYMMDDFQDDLEYNKRVHAGTQFFHCSHPSELTAKLRALPSRETRELSVMAQRLAFADDMSKFTSDSAKSFARDMLARNAALCNLISVAKDSDFLEGTAI